MVKLVFVAAIWVIGPVIDTLVEPRFQRLAPTLGEPPSPTFIQIKKQFLALEIVATLSFYVIIMVWVLA